MQPEKLGEGKLVNINEERGCDEKVEYMPGEVTLAKSFTLKELSEVFHNIDIANDKRLGDNLYLERSRSIYQGIEKMLTCI